MQPRGTLRNDGTQRIVKYDTYPAPSDTVEERSVRNVETEHLFQTECLCTELNAITIVQFRLPTFVLDGEGLYMAGRIAVELHHIRLASQTQLEGSYSQRTHRTYVAASLGCAAIGPFIQMASLDRKPVLCPCVLNMNECTLSLAEQQVLLCGYWEEVIFGEHRSQNLLRPVVNGYSGRQLTLVEHHIVIRKFARWFRRVLPLDMESVEQSVRRRVTQRILMLESPAALSRH